MLTLWTDVLIKVVPINDQCWKQPEGGGLSRPPTPHTHISPRWCHHCVFTSSSHEPLLFHHHWHHFMIAHFSSWTLPVWIASHRPTQIPPSLTPVAPSYCTSCNLINYLHRNNSAVKKDVFYWISNLIRPGLCGSSEGMETKVYLRVAALSDLFKSLCSWNVFIMRRPWQHGLAHPSLCAHTPHIPLNGLPSATQGQRSTGRGSPNGASQRQGGSLIEPHYIDWTDFAAEL